MTSSSLKKRPITRPNTSTFGSRAGWLASFALLCAGATTLSAAPPRVIQPVQRSLKPLSTAVPAPRSAAPYRANQAVRAEPQRVQPPAATVTPAAVPPGTLTRAPLPSVDSSSPPGYVARPVASDFPPKAPPADRPVVAAADVKEPAPQDAVRQVSAEEVDLAPVPTQPTNRRFKRIHEILPHFDYSPEGNIRRCDNLCPRPSGVDCPDCEPPTEEYSAESCPECPPEVRLVDVDPHNSQVAAIGQRAFGQINYCWEPSNLYHLPIYFEDFCLERYGHTRHYVIQPFVSTGLFATQLLGLPYQMTIDPICKKRYVLGWYRPGTYVPYRYYQVPWNTEAAIVEAGFVVGGYYLFAPSVSP